MPYIKAAYRIDLNVGLNELYDQLDFLIDKYPNDKNGMLTYLIYMLVNEYYFGSFESYSDGIKVLECAKMEFYRKRVAPYEDLKIEEHGDI